MARVPNEKAAKAEAMYHDGMKLVDIARKLDVPPGTVRRWKSTYHWDGILKKNKTSVRIIKANVRINQKHVIEAVR